MVASWERIKAALLENILVDSSGEKVVATMDVLLVQEMDCKTVVTMAHQ